MSKPEERYEFDDMEEFRQYKKTLDKAIQLYKTSSFLFTCAMILQAISIILSILTLFK